MTYSTYPRSVAKYIRRQKAQIRRQVSNKQAAQAQIKELLVSVEGSRKKT
jgi:hypothetical protein